MSIISRCEPNPDEVGRCAKQEYAKELDMNEIMKRAQRTGVLPSMEHQPIFADVSGIGDFSDVMRRVDAAREAFEAMPAKVRTRFGNRADALIAFLQDEANIPEAIELGLVSAKADPVEPVAPVVPAPNAPAVK